MLFHVEQMAHGIYGVAWTNVKHERVDRLSALQYACLHCALLA